jgi:hypothetical protein
MIAAAIEKTADPCFSPSVFAQPRPKADMTGLASVYEVFKRQTDSLFATPIP